MSAANTFGQRFVIHAFGESHGPALGVVIDGCPAGLPFNEALLRMNLERRRPGTSVVVSARAEPDEPEVLSGIYQGRTLGTPITIIVRNNDARSEDYNDLAAGRQSRPGHADDTWRDKFGHVDPRGGGRSSGRETVCRVLAGSVAQMLVEALAPGAEVHAYTRQMGELELQPTVEHELAGLSTLKLRARIDESPTRLPDRALAESARLMLESAKLEGKSYGGVASVLARNIPPSLGQPVFHKLKSDLAAAFLTVGATAGVDLGAGFEASRAEGSAFHFDSGAGAYGGVRGGITTGEPLYLRVGFKPTSSVLDVAKKGRHDPCIVPRALPVLEAMTYLVLADHLLWARTDRVTPG